MQKTFFPKYQLLFSLWLVLILVVSSANAQTPAGSEEFLQLINGARQSRAVGLLAWNDILAEAAQQHAEDIAITGRFDHTGSDGSNEQQRATRLGYGSDPNTVLVSENWARGTIAEAFAIFLETEPHRSNMFSAKWREVGIGSAKSSIFQVWVVVFGAQPGILPIFINNGQHLTKEQSVTIQLSNQEIVYDERSFSRPIEMRVAEEHLLPNAPWQAWQPQIELQLSQGDGQKVVVAELRDAQGRIARAWDTIYLDTVGYFTSAETVLPTATFATTATPTTAWQASVTPIATWRATATPIATWRATATPTSTQLNMRTPIPIWLTTATPTSTWVTTETSTPTWVPSTTIVALATPIGTETSTPTWVPSTAIAATETSIATETSTPTAKIAASATPAATLTVVASATAVVTLKRFATGISATTPTLAASATYIRPPTITPTTVSTHSASATPTTVSTHSASATPSAKSTTSIPIASATKAKNKLAAAPVGTLTPASFILSPTVENHSTPTASGTPTLTPTPLAIANATSSSLLGGGTVKQAVRFVTLLLIELAVLFGIARLLFLGGMMLRR